ncbi:MAG: carboxypeptidase-like regulatory domain-containing protein [Candidatus Udaeobacter sp.]
MFIKSLQIGLMGFLLCAASVWAGPTSIQGIVKDASGQPIKGADVRIESVDGKQLFKTVKTNARGRYVSQGLQLRVYRVTLLVNGAVKACITNIKTKQDQATELNLDLKRVAAVRATTEQKKGKNMVWLPARTGSHLGGNWVEVDEYGKAASDSNIHTGTGEDLRRQQLTQPTGSLPGAGPTPFP